MRKIIVGIFVCLLLISSTSTLALTPFRRNEQQTKNQFFDSTPIPLPTSSGWMKTFGGENSDTGHSVRQTSDGGYIVVGSTFSFGNGQADFWVIKTDGNGNKVWDKTFGGLYWDIPSDVKQTKDKGYIITGRTHSFGAGGIDIWVVKLDETGNVQWNITYGSQYDEGGLESQQTTDGGYIIIGSKSLYQFSGYDAWLIKIDDNGNEQWNRTFGGQSEDYGHSVQQTSDGGYIVAGSTRSYGTNNNSTAAFWLIKTDQYGTMQWNRTYGGITYDTASSVQLTTDGGYIILGSKNIAEPTKADIWIIKTNQYGDEQWNRTYGGLMDDYGNAAYQTSDGGYIMIGTTSSYGVGSEDAWMIKTDTTGDELWNKTYGGKSSDTGNSFNQTMDGGYIITGYTGSYGKKNYTSDIWLIKTDSQGKSKTNSLIPSRNTCDIENGTNLSFWLCQLSVDGITMIQWAAFFGFYVEFNGTIHIKAFQALNVDTNELGDYFGTYELTGNFKGIFRHFLFQHSSEPNQMEGVCINVILVRAES